MTVSHITIARETAHTEEANAKRQATWESKRTLQDEDIILLWDRGMVPLAIADKLGTRVERVASVLREQGIGIPSYLTTRGGKRPTEFCPHCKKRI